ncbi:beta-phosphoglucomutase [Anaerophaga thermohalophila]|jgi:beta-phosphoglucomutase|uniref:beta-phosphoglucomutase n=1 Tax=Anaerophaga thermohalophila TaxID=177400 RepID=UPI000308155A|nr:beta-phosphoglucomutase [Anaerophaga thermohalophila]
MVKGCIFDLDGVIVDTARYHFIAWKELANELGFEFSEKDNERLKGVSRMRSLDILLEIGDLDFPQEKKEELAKKKNENYRSYILKMTPDEILPGAMEFIKEVKENNILTAVGSASKNAMTILDRLQLTSWFDAIVDGTKVSKAKPDPEVFLKGAEELKLQPADCVVFEDAEAGVEAALRGGMKCVGIGSPENLGKAHLVVSGLHDMNMQKLSQL